MIGAAVDDHEVVGIAAALRSLAPARVVVGARRVDAADLAHLFSSERRTIQRSVSKRQHEFASGRFLLRSLIGMDVEIPVGAGRAPELPEGIVGSLAHDRDFVVAAVSRDPLVRSLGVDIEPLDPLSEDMARAILRPDEAGLDAHVAFTLKEAAYKAWSNAGGRILEHHDVRLRVDGGSFRAEITTDRTCLEGVSATVNGRCIALVVVETPVLERS